MGTIVSIGGSGSNDILAQYPMLTDAFGRLRVSEPFTLFDSSHRFADNNLWSTATAVSGTATFDAGSINILYE
jgi:hypothetical protein